MKFKCVAWFLSVWLASVFSAGVIKLASPDGLLVTSDQLKNFILSKGATEVHSTSFVKSYDGESHLFDNSFGVKFGPDDAIHLTTDASQSYLTPFFESLNTKKYFGCKALDFCCSISSNICVLVSGKEFVHDRVCFDQCVRRIVKDIAQATDKSLTLVVDTSSSSLSGPADQKAFEISLESFVKSVTTEHFPQSSITPKVSVLFADFQSEESLAGLRTALGEVSASRSLPAIGADKLAATIHSKWASLSSEIPKPVYTQEEKKSLFVIESAFAVGLSQIEAAVASWQRRVGGSGKLVGKFSDRVRSLTRSVQDSFKLKTAGTITVRERNRRLQELKETIKQAATTLFNQQLAIVQSKISSNLKKSLLAVAEPTKETELQALRNALFDFKAAVADLEIEEIGLKLSSSVVSEVSSKLQTIATELPESPVAKLAEAKKLEEQAKSPKKKGARGLNVALNLVGMFRPPGFGNLQGFANYATSLMGLPLELLLGFQNDGDSPDVMGEDREYPLLRLQPKVHFDIDL